MSCISSQPSLRILKNLMCIRIKRSSSSSMKLLTSFYPDKIHASRDFQKCLTTYKMMGNLATNGDLQKIDDRHLAPRYRISLQGKCKVLCEKFQIRLLCLCILAESYALHKIQLENGCHPSYSLFEMYRIFEGIFSQKTIRNSANILSAKGLAYSKFSNIIAIRENVMKDLAMHDATLEEIHEWIIGIPNCLNQLAMEDPQAYDEIVNSR